MKLKCIHKNLGRYIWDLNTTYIQYKELAQDARFISWSKHPLIFIYCYLYGTYVHRTLQINSKVFTFSWLDLIWKTSSIPHAQGKICLLWPPKISHCISWRKCTWGSPLIRDNWSKSYETLCHKTGTKKNALVNSIGLRGQSAVTQGVAYTLHLQV